MVTIFDSSDLTSAIQCSRTLKLTVFLNNQSEASVDSKQQKSITNISAIRKELSGIRDRVISLLDQLDLTSPQETPNRDSPLQIESDKQNVQAVKPTPVHAKEFDPYQQQNDVGKETDKVSEAFGVEPANQGDGTATRPPATGLSSTLAVASQPLAPQLQSVPGIQQLGPQGVPSNTQHPMQQPTLGSPYPGSAYQQQSTMGQQRFQPPQTSTAYALSAQQSTTYPQAGYSPQPVQQQQPYSQQIPYNSQGSAQPQQQNQPQIPGAPTYSGASQQPQAYNPAVSSQGSTLGQTLPQGQTGFNYPGYRPTATTPTNPYSRGGQPAPPYASRPQYR